MSRILVVEDNEKNMYLIGFILKKMGHQVLQAGTGEQGVEVALRESPDLILMDIQLPGISGLEATQRIRGAEPGKAVPIVAITSLAMAGDREKLLAAGCSGYIEKPIDPDLIIEQISAFLRGAP
jgi:two-component system, cell cycle response regulator DivK